MAAFELTNPIIAALDVDSAEECLRLADLLGSKVGALKLGPRLIVRYGAELVKTVAAKAPVFVDNKYLDIPNTMESAIRATFAAGATLATIHAWSGSEALSRLAKVEAELNRQRPFKILVVTVLTSFSKDTLPPSLQSVSIAEQVSDLARFASGCGLNGLVCSPHEVALQRAQLPEVFLVTPGVRLPTDELGDQKRVETPAEAMRLGASALVIGRPIVEAKDPVLAVERMMSSIHEGLALRGGHKS